MPDTDLAASDIDVAERMAQLPDDVLGLTEEGASSESVEENAADANEEAEDQTEASKEGEDEDEPEVQAQAEEDPEFEIADPSNPEAKQTLKLSELVQSHRELSAFRHERTQILQREEAKAREYSTQRMQQVEDWSRQAATQLQAAMQIVQPPRPPDISMRDPRSPNYDPDQYEIARYQYEVGMERYRAGQAYAQQLTQQAQSLEKSRQEERETLELQRLTKAWPEFTKPETMNAFVADAEKFFGFSAQELDSILVDHRQALVLREAINSRKGKASAGTLQAKVVAKAPAKAVKPEAAKRHLSREDAQHMQARKVMKESGGKNMAAAAKAFEKFV